MWAEVRPLLSKGTTQFFRPSDSSLRDRDTMVLDSGQSNFVAILVATTIHTNIYLEFKVFEVSGLLSCSLDPTTNSKNVSLKFHEFFDQWEQFYESFFNDFVITDWNIHENLEVLKWDPEQDIWIYLIQDRKWASIF